MLTTTCSGDSVVAAAIHEQSGADIWDGDVNEMIRSLQLLLSVTQHVEIPVLSSTFESTGTNTNLLTLKLSNLELVTLPTSLGGVEVPYTLMVGADRGGMVATLAAGRSGFYLFEQADGENSAIAAAVAANADISSISTILPISVLTLGTNFFSDDGNE